MTKPIDQQRAEFESAAEKLNESLERPYHYIFEPVDQVAHPGWTYDSIRTELSWRIWQEQERRHEAEETRLRRLVCDYCAHDDPLGEDGCHELEDQTGKPMRLRCEAVDDEAA
jgi:hypothetical protein